MDYRNERDALRGRVDNLEDKLAEANQALEKKASEPDPALDAKIDAKIDEAKAELKAELKAESKGESKFEKVADKNASLVGEIFGFLGQNKKWWLLPIMGTFLVIGILVLLSTTAAAPFIYTLF